MGSRKHKSGCAIWRTDVRHIPTLIKSGMVAGAMINGPALNRAYAATKRAHDERLRASGIKVPDVIDRSDLGVFPIERARLKSLPGSVAIFVVCSISYGWSLQRIWPLAVPLVLQFFIGTATMIQFNAITTLLVDLYPLASASATASNNLIRCLVGAAATAIVNPMIQAIGSGWAFTTAGLVIVSVTPLLWVEWEYGQRFRSRRRARLNDKIMAREEQKRKEPEERKAEP
ncbi:hypothetical protein MVLG_02069 [Microbotryum lychnidis-dioicae p1A1 Lamole]|uniref:Major facilitator superfamily (MFS) profile domain-containing protein n=1 Tax=Microbotryum lychnidis-dioicae (strain p1A1 Lamole / MvSl-1064) TaxID=683840 RepID=U5H418_USTV1|nr:hypothetical protein MVLG_02069 [Microbotryum lychnidis-dioicae p1A1 Lamole]|eukprot:KDE07603.1 hypothetical protein MVLG_02069 [Microbotryum lychnidis-dioicae p1A1 Lamole]